MNTPSYAQQLHSAVEAVTITSSTNYSWFGRPAETLPKHLVKAMSERTARRFLLTQLQNQLYGEFYIRGKAAEKLWNDEVERDANNGFVEQLSAANTGHGCCERGWMVSRLEEGTLLVQRYGLTLWVTRDDVTVRGYSPICCGAEVELRLPKELRSLSPGYYFALGDRSDPKEPEGGIVRFYWNLRPETAATFLRETTTALNHDEFPFRLKLLSDSRSYKRCDAAVLYTAKSDYVAVAKRLHHIYANIGAQLKPATPAFTKMLAPGLGLAEDPGSSESFGQHRCRLLAEGMIRAYERGAPTLAKRLEYVEECFSEAGLELARPYLEPHSEDIYTFAEKTRLLQ